MNFHFNNSTNATAYPTLPAGNANGGLNPVARVCYTIICVLAIFGNSLTIVMFAKERNLLKKSYNILILALAIADVLTAINVIIHPAYVLGDAFPRPTNVFQGELFCRFISSRSIVFHLVFFSVYISLFLTAERWCAVVKPHWYSIAFSQKKVLGYVLFSWAWSFLLMSEGIVNRRYVPASNKICQRKHVLGSMFFVFWYALQITLKLLLPCIAMIGLYIHMIVKTTKSPVASSASKAKLKGRMTRMVALASFILIILYIPNQIIFILSIAGKARSDTLLHKSTSLLTFLTTCINPFIYGLSNKNYQERYRNILCALCPKQLVESPRVENIETASSKGSQQWFRAATHETNLDL